MPSAAGTHLLVSNLFQSSLLSALLGELPRSQGLVSVHGRIAYVSQQPWVFAGTVRSNILFGKKYEKERYEKVIKACALRKVRTFELHTFEFQVIIVLIEMTRLSSFFFFESSLDII